MQSAQGLPIKTIKKATAQLTHELVRMARFAGGMPGCSPWQASLARIARVAGLLVFLAGVPAWAQTGQEAQPSYLVSRHRRALGIAPMAEVTLSNKGVQQS